MVESHEQRIARLTELAKKVWPSFDGFHVESVDGKQDDGNHYPSWAEMRASTEKPRNREFWSLLHIDKLWETNEARALDALEAALCVLAGEPPRWAVELAEEWRRVRASMEGTGQADALGVCANDLLEAAKGGAR